MKNRFWLISVLLNLSQHFCTFINGAPLTFLWTTARDRWHCTGYYLILNIPCPSFSKKSNGPWHDDKMTSATTITEWRSISSKGRRREYWSSAKSPSGQFHLNSDGYTTPILSIFASSWNDLLTVHRWQQIFNTSKLKYKVNWS